jgi:hypothetical protein
VSSPFETWTIDHERDAVLVCRNYGAGPDGQGVSSFGLQWRGDYAPIAATRLWKGKKIIWDGASLYLTTEQMAQKEQWYALAHEALMTFGFAGGVVDPQNPPPDIIQVNLTVKPSQA